MPDGVGTRSAGVGNDRGGSSDAERVFKSDHLMLRLVVVNPRGLAGSTVGLIDRSTAKFFSAIHGTGRSAQCDRNLLCQLFSRPVCGDESF